MENIDTKKLNEKVSEHSDTLETDLAQAKKELEAAKKEPNNQTKINTLETIVRNLEELKDGNNN
jgi:hypothetical protein